MSVKGEKYKSMAVKMKHEKMEGPAMRLKEYGPKKTAKKATVKKVAKRVAKKVTVVRKKGM